MSTTGSLGGPGPKRKISAFYWYTWSWRVVVFVFFTSCFMMGEGVLFFVCGFHFFNGFRHGHLRHTQTFANTGPYGKIGNNTTIQTLSVPSVLTLLLLNLPSFAFSRFGLGYCGGQPSPIMSLLLRTIIDNRIQGRDTKEQKEAQHSTAQHHHHFTPHPPPNNNAMQSKGMREASAEWGNTRPNSAEHGLCPF